MFSGVSGYKKNISASAENRTRSSAMVLQRANPHTTEARVIPGQSLYLSDLINSEPTNATFASVAL